MVKVGGGRGVVGGSACVFKGGGGEGRGCEGMAFLVYKGEVDEGGEEGGMSIGLSGLVG